MAVVLIGVLLNNSRISDLRTDLASRLNDLNARMSEMSAHVDSRIGDMRDLIHQQAIAQYANLRRVEDMMLGKFAELGNRLSRIEAHLNLR